MTGDPLDLAFVDDRAILTLNRPEKRNALTRAMWADLPGRLAEVEAARITRVLIVRGAGGVFAAGADIAEFEMVYATRESTAAYFDAVGRAMDALQNLGKPTIAAIEGPCVGGGMALALCCDLRLAASDARFAITPARLGLTYSLADTRRLIEAVGPSAARDMLFTGRMLDAGEALRIGLVNAVHPAEAFEARVLEKAREIAGASAWTVRTTKQIVRMILDGTRRDTDQTSQWLLDAVEGGDFKEGRDAFLAKRPPSFPRG